MNRVDQNEILTAQIRALQSMHNLAHLSLVNWGAWCLDRRGIFPAMKPPGWAQQYRAAEGEEWGAEPEEAPVAPAMKSEAPDRPSYNEKAAIELDERLHAPGGPNVEQRRAIKAAYCTTCPEYQLPAISGCVSHDAFRERLEACLVFVGRYS